ncbi:hypothetical protein NBRC116493_13170 [Aurantivibrio infirmus]
MRLNNSTLSIGLMTTILVTACGGGGGGSSGGGSATPPPPPAPAANTPPTISGSPISAIEIGETYSFTPTAADQDNDTLTFSVANEPSWLTIDPQSGELSGVPSVKDLGSFSDIVISVSDGSVSAALSGFSVDVAPPVLGENKFVSEGIKTPVDTGNPMTTGYVAEGTMVIDFPGESIRLEESNLQLEFDEEGNLIDLFGDTLIPQKVSDNLAITGNVKAKVGLYKGSEINADPDLDIDVKDDFYYFVYFIGVSTEIVVGDRDDPNFGKSITLDLPLGGEILMIVDPLDVFTYYYANTPAGEIGHGESDNGFIPFIPKENFVGLDEFDGHIIDRAGFGIGFKVFDFFNISGTRIIHQPEFGEIDWDDPLNSPIEYKAGFNGDASFAFAVLGVGLFDFSLATTSASFDAGFDRQHVAMQTTIAPDVSWQPSWFPILPTTEIIGSWLIDGNGDYSALLSGSYQSTIPAANISGAMSIDANGVTLAGQIPDGALPLTVSANFLNDTATYKITTTVDVGNDVTGAVNQALDRELEKLTDALADLEQATADYELELSLNGLRSALPTIVDAVVSTLNGVPDTVYTSVRQGVIDYVDNYETCVNLGLGTVCSNPLDPLVNQASVGTTAGNTARNTARTKIKPYVDALEEIKALSLSADDEQYKAGIKAALLKIYNNRNFDQTITVSVSLPLGLTRNFSKRVNFAVLDTQTANRVKAAHDNAHKIQETSDLKISAQQIFDAIPSDAIISQAKQDVQDGLAQIPVFKGAAFTVSNGSYSAQVLLGDEAYDVDINVLSPVELLQGIGDLIAENLTAN